MHHITDARQKSNIGVNAQNGFHVVQLTLTPGMGLDFRIAG